MDCTAYKDFSGEDNSRIIDVVDQVLKDEFELSNIKNVLFSNTSLITLYHLQNSLFVLLLVLIIKNISEISINYQMIDFMCQI